MVQEMWCNEPAASKQIAKIEEMGFSDFPVCMAKNQYSLSDDAKKLGRPENFDIHIREYKKIRQKVLVTTGILMPPRA